MQLSAATSCAPRRASRDIKAIEDMVGWVVRYSSKVKMNVGMREEKFKVDQGAVQGFESGDSDYVICLDTRTRFFGRRA